ncbi:hypothetical protein [Gorillibacterium sp. sgz5001074]|uniref:hypothetical protein n=1 Tax=Gorillibacterium sp. sgz5001074 TaxID=3446695 RepID=UPI003F66AA9F
MSSTKQQQAAAMDNLKRSEAWPILEKYLRDRIADRKGKLMSCETMKEVREHRGAAKALEAVLIFIDKTIDEGMNENA